MSPPRAAGFAHDRPPSPLERVGRALSLGRIRRAIGPVGGKRCADIGCGHDAKLARELFADAADVWCLDVTVDEIVDARPNYHRIEGWLPGTLDEVPSIDIAIANNVIEHLDDPRETVERVRETLAPGGVFFINVPNWAGKVALETVAFRLQLSDPTEIEDHKRYFSRSQLWQLARDSGFAPSGIRCGTHKLGLNTWALCRVDP